MINEDNISGLLAVLAGMIIFKSTTYLETFEGWMREYPLIMIGLALLLFFQRKTITQKFRGNSK